MDATQNAGMDTPLSFRYTVAKYNETIGRLGMDNETLQAMLKQEQSQRVQQKRLDDAYIQKLIDFIASNNLQPPPREQE